MTVTKTLANITKQKYFIVGWIFEIIKYGMGFGIAWNNLKNDLLLWNFISFF